MAENLKQVPDRTHICAISTTAINVRGLLFWYFPLTKAKTKFYGKNRKQKLNKKPQKAIVIQTADSHLILNSNLSA